MIELQKVKDWSDVLLKLITIIAIPVGGWWAYYNFSMSDSGEINPVISVSADVLPYDTQNALLVAHLRYICTKSTCYPKHEIVEFLCGLAIVLINLVTSFSNHDDSLLYVRLQRAAALGLLKQKFT